MNNQNNLVVAGVPPVAENDMNYRRAARNQNIGVLLNIRDYNLPPAELENYCKIAIQMN